MASISIVTDGQPAKLLANPIYVTSRTQDRVEFEVLEVDASALHRFVGTPQLLAIDEITLWGQLLSLEPCASTAAGLAMLRDRPALQGTLRIYPGEPAFAQ